MTRKLLKSTVVVSAMTLISRILGFVRDVLIARFFGVFAGTDAFFVALRVPNLLRRLFGEGAFSLAFVPVLNEYKVQRGPEEERELVDRTAGTLATVVLGIVIVGVAAAPAVIAVLAPGFLLRADAQQFELATVMLRITFPYALFITLVAFAGGVLNTHGRFAVPAFTPVLLNLSLIGALLWLAPYLAEPVVALAWGLFIAGAAQLAFQVPFLRRIRLWPRLRWGWRHSGVRRILRLMVPALFGSSVSQINIVVDTIIASFLITGSVSWLFYADRLFEFPLGVLGLAVGTVILPSLSRRHAENEPARFSHTLDWAVRWIALIGLPAAVGLLVLAGPILTTLFQYGEFTRLDARMATFALMAYSIGLLGFLLVKVLAPGFYARQDTRTPVRIGVIAMFSNIALNLIFVVPLARLGFQAPHAGLALATSMAAWINASLLLRNLRREGIYQPRSGWVWFLARVLIAAGTMALVLWFATPGLERWLDGSVLQRAAWLAGLVGGGAAIYFGMLWALGFRPWVWKVRPHTDDL